MTTPAAGTPEPADTSPLDAQETTMDDAEPMTPIPQTAPLGSVDREPVPAPAASTPPAGARPRLRVGTTVWGLVVVAVGLGLIAIAAGAVFDVQLATIVLIAAAGVALLVGSLLTATGRRR
jgi:hypothetical protein